MANQNEDEQSFNAMLDDEIEVRMTMSDYRALKRDKQNYIKFLDKYNTLKLKYNRELIQTAGQVDKQEKQIQELRGQINTLLKERHKNEASHDTIILEYLKNQVSVFEDQELFQDGAIDEY